MSDKQRVSLVVNGESHEREVSPRTTLCDFLRQDLRLTGTNVGCEHGVCGACTVHVGGQAVRSCLMLAVQADGLAITTVEGLSEAGEALHPIQEAFIEEHGLQCGFCTPGFMMTTLELLRMNPHPSDDEIVEALGGNICRCTGYQSIVRSVHAAAAKMEGARLAGSAEPA
jgi:carbon-monoxide dehydrogenase small subunit